jgi:hypothetical protein
MVKSILIWVSLLFLCGAIVQFDRTQWAGSTPFDNSTNGFTSTDVQAAIEEAKLTAVEKSRYAVGFGFDGNASSGRWLETHTNIASNVSGYVAAKPAILKEISLACSSASTITVGIYRNAAQIATIVMTSQKIDYEDENVNLTNGDEISAKVESGSCTRPSLFIHMRYQ